MNRWSLVGASCLLAGCGLFQVRVNGEVKNLGGSSTGTQTASEEGRDPSRPESASAKNKESRETAKSDKERLEALRKETREIRNAIDKLVQSDPGPLPAEKLQALNEKRKSFESDGLEAEVHYLSHLLTYYKMENAWRGDAAKTAESLAQTLGGAVALTGEVTGKDKPQTFKLKAEEGKCYTILLRMKSAGGEEDKMTSFSLDAGKDSSSLQHFDMDGRTTRGAGSHSPLSKSYIRGACALKGTEITATVEMKYAGSTNGLKYVVVETARDKFPQYVALEIQPRVNDSCDVDNWMSMWTNPIPGTVLYGAEAPFVPYDVGQAEEMWMTAWSSGYGEVRAKREDLSSSPPKQLKFNNKMQFRGCPHELKFAKSADGIKVATCYTNLDKKFNPQFDSAQRARDNAPGILAEIAAERRLTALNNQYSDEMDRTCKKMEADVGKKFEVAYNKIVDFYSATPVKSAFDRGHELKLTYQGAVAIGCAGQYSCSL